MNDTVRKLLELADDYAMSSIQYGIFSNERGDAKDALKAELVRLFTPLSDEQIESVNYVYANQLDYDWFEIHQPSVFEFARAIETMHGIGDQK